MERKALCCRLLFSNGTVQGLAVTDLDKSKRKVKIQFYKEKNGREKERKQEQVVKQEKQEILPTVQS